MITLFDNSNNIKFMLSLDGPCVFYIHRGYNQPNIVHFLPYFYFHFTDKLICFHYKNYAMLIKYKNV